MITIYKSNETDFGHLGLGVLSDFEKGKAFVLRERNGQYIFEGTYPVGGNNAEKIEKGNILKMSAGSRTGGQLFDIIRTVKINNREIRIYAEHYSYRTKRLGLKPEFGVSGNGDMALSIWRNNLVGEHNFETWSDVTTTANVSWRIDKMQNARNALGGVSGSILDVWGGEYEFDNNKVKLWSNMGRRSPAAIIYGKNLTDLEQDERIDKTYTSIYPYAVKDEVIYTLDELYVDSNYVSNYHQRRIAVKDFSNEFDHEESITQDKLRSLSVKFIESNRVGIPKTTTEVEFVDIAQTLEDASLLKEAEEIELCDVLTVIYPKLNIRNTEAKVVATKWDPVREAYISITVGSISTSLKSTIIQDLTDRVDQVEHNTQVVMMSANGINRIYRSVTEPIPPTTGFNVNDQWWQPNGEFMRIYFWTGDSWRLDMDTESYKKQLDAKFEEQAKIDEKIRKDIANAEASAKSAYDRAGVGESLAKEFEAIIQQGGYASLKDSLGDVSLATEERLKDGFKTMVYNPDGSLAINEITSKYIQDSIIDDDYISNQIQTSEMIQNVIKAQVPVPTDDEIKRIAESVKLTKSEIEALFADGFLSDADIQEIAAKAQIDPEKVKELVDGQISNAMVQKYEEKEIEAEHINGQATFMMNDGNYIGEYVISKDLELGSVYILRIKLPSAISAQYITITAKSDNATIFVKQVSSFDITTYHLVNESFQLPSNRVIKEGETIILKIVGYNDKPNSVSVVKKEIIQVPIELGSGIISSKITQMNNNIDLALFGQEGATTRINLGDGEIYLGGGGAKIRLDGTTIMDDAYANNLFAKAIEAGSIKANSATIADLLVVNIDVNSLTGNKAQFIQTLWQAAYTNVYVDGTHIGVKTNNGTNAIEMNQYGLDVFDSLGRPTGNIQWFDTSNTDLSSFKRGAVGIGIEGNTLLSLGTKSSNGVFENIIGIDGNNNNIILNNMISEFKSLEGLVFDKKTRNGKLYYGWTMGQKNYGDAYPMLKGTGFYAGPNDVLISTGSYYYSFKSLLNSLNELLSKAGLGTYNV